MKLIFIALNEFKLLLRDRPAVLLMIAVPIAVITVTGFALGSIYGKSEAFVRIYLPVADLDKGFVSKSFIETLQKDRTLEVEITEYRKATKLVRDENKAAAALIIPENFTADIISRKPVSLRLLTDPAKGLEVMTAKALITASAIKLATGTGSGGTGLDSVEIRGENLTGIKGNISSFDENVPGFSIMSLLQNS